MKKATVLGLMAFLFLSAKSQVEVGYTTTDIGGQFQCYPSGKTASLHVAFNSRLYHSFLIQAGYNKFDRKDNGEKDAEKGSGLGGAIGYRYHFKPYPYKLFLGVKADVWRINTDWMQGEQAGQTNTWMLQPTFEIGYTFIINSQAFITPSISNGVQINFKTEGDNVRQGFVTLVGISAGFRL